MATGAVYPGSSVTRLGHPLRLSEGTLRVGDQLPRVELTNIDWNPYFLNGNGKIKLISVVPSIDTTTCDYQTTQLDETGELNARIERISLSRRKRFGIRADGCHRQKLEVAE